MVGNNYVTSLGIYLIVRRAQRIQTFARTKTATPESCHILCVPLGPQAIGSEHGKRDVPVRESTLFETARFEPWRDDPTCPTHQAR